MRRRRFIILAGGMAAWPLAARAQALRSGTPSLPIIGFLNGQSFEGNGRNLAAFLRGLKESGYVDRENVTVEYRWAENRSDRLQALAADLAGRSPAVLVATGGDFAAHAAKSATTTTPLVILIGADPIKAGFARSLNQPGGSITGITILTSALIEKRLGIVRELMPAATTIAFLTHPDSPNVQANTAEAEAATRALGYQLQPLSARTEVELESAFAQVDRPTSALVISTGSYFLPFRERLLALATARAIPAIYDRQEFVTAGGLLSYGVAVADMYRHVGVYTGLIVQGRKPGDLPFLQPTTFELAINLKAAKALGLAIPSSLLVTADEVIE